MRKNRRQGGKVAKRQRGKRTPCHFASLPPCLLLPAMPLHLIQTLPEYSDLLERLRLEPLVAVDTEAASFHRHKDRVYLLQLSTRTETHLVDPLAVAGLPGFGELLADPAIELVFHDADYDLRLLGYEFGFRAATLFDTRIAAQFLNEPGIGLARSEEHTSEL